MKGCANGLEANELDIRPLEATPWEANGFAAKGFGVVVAPAGFEAFWEPKVKAFPDSIMPSTACARLRLT